MPLRKILIANRGEIALRIIRTCKELGIQSIAVYSDADKEMPFVQEADYSFRIGEPPVNRSYLNMDAIIEIAVREKADAIHPGYGLLSENGEFARKAEAAGVAFIGPPASVISSMGDKITARNIMKEAGVPVVPGSGEGLSSWEEAAAAAEAIGYPVMLKASGGGGGIGMIRCENEQALNQHFESTKNRAKAYFGSDAVFIEKCIDEARHIEVQVFGDSRGHAVHLFERNCSVQRRNQKVMEEAPSPALSEQARNGLYQAAVAAAEAVGYKNAGTVEFIVDEKENFYFLEMNTRLQVEHPVTEAITGLDLVNWQIQIAQGSPIPIGQDNITRNGHGVELRIYAEDPDTFLPSPGTIQTLRWGNVEGVRIDEGYAEGNAVTPFYDPMIAKCIIHADERGECLKRAKKFLKETVIEGIKTNIPALLEVLENEEVVRGDYTTNVMAKRAKTNK